MFASFSGALFVAELVGVAIAAVVVSVFATEVSEAFPPFEHAVAVAIAAHTATQAAPATTRVSMTFLPFKSVDAPSRAGATRAIFVRGNKPEEERG